MYKNLEKEVVVQYNRLIVNPTGSNTNNTTPYAVYFAIEYLKWIIHVWLGPARRQADQIAQHVCIDTSP
jgi:hypothetical protein